MLPKLSPVGEGAGSEGRPQFHTYIFNCLGCTRTHTVLP